MRTKQLGQRVKVTGGMKEFVGKVGTIIDTEKYGGNSPTMYRVRFDDLVEVSGVGMVRDDLWEGQYLRNIRS